MGFNHWRAQVEPLEQTMPWRSLSSSMASPKVREEHKAAWFVIR